MKLKRDYFVSLYSGGTKPRPSGCLLRKTAFARMFPIALTRVYPGTIDWLEVAISKR